MARQRNNPFGSIFGSRVFILSLICLLSFVVGQDLLYSEPELQALSDEELEKICVDRGFEIVKDDIDPTTGLLYELKHSDFVEAAQRCLAIEQEMNELLEQYPELAEEIEEEINRMEAENSARQAEVEELQQKLSKAEDSAKEKSAKSAGSAFVSETVPPHSDGNADETAEIEQATVPENLDTNDQEVKDDEAKVAESETTTNPAESETTTNPADSETTANPEETEESVVNDDESNPANDKVEGNVEPPPKPSDKEDLTMRALMVELIRGLVKNAENDLKRIVELMAPVIQPLLGAGGAAWRRIREAIVLVKKHYESSSKEEETAETCADEVPADA